MLAIDSTNIKVAYHVSLHDKLLYRLNLRNPIPDSVRSMDFVKSQNIREDNKMMWIFLLQLLNMSTECERLSI